MFFRYVLSHSMFCVLNLDKHRSILKCLLSFVWSFRKFCSVCSIMSSVECKLSFIDKERLRLLVWDSFDVYLPKAYLMKTRFTLTYKLKKQRGRALQLLD